MSRTIPAVGVAIAVYNRRERTQQCLNALLSCSYSALKIVVVDDGSADGTWEMLENEYPQVTRIRGSGNLWWSAGNNVAIEECLRMGCQYVLMLNPDAIVSPDTVETLVEYAIAHPRTITAALVVDIEDKNRIWWAGTRWGRLGLIPIWVSRYLYRKGDPVAAAGTSPYETTEVHGRAVLIYREVFSSIGLYDARVLPHYGADIDFSFRARSAGSKLVIVPQARVALYTREAGNTPPQEGLILALRQFWKYMFVRKNGDVARVTWHLTKRHVPWYGVLPTYIFCLLLTSWRFWSRALLSSRLRLHSSGLAAKTS
jgi:GT2 family glycosyltransferase